MAEALAQCRSPCCVYGVPRRPSLRVGLSGPSADSGRAYSLDYLDRIPCRHCIDGRTRGQNLVQLSSLRRSPYWNP